MVDVGPCPLQRQLEPVLDGRRDPVSMVYFFRSWVWSLMAPLVFLGPRGSYHAMLGLDYVVSLVAVRVAVL